jgi:hypothetical protein
MFPVRAANRAILPVLWRDPGFVRVILACAADDPASFGFVRITLDCRACGQMSQISQRADRSRSPSSNPPDYSQEKGISRSVSI